MGGVCGWQKSGALGALRCQDMLGQRCVYRAVEEGQGMAIEGGGGGV